VAGYTTPDGEDGPTSPESPAPPPPGWGQASGTEADPFGFIAPPPGPPISEPPPYAPDVTRVDFTSYPPDATMVDLPPYASQPTALGWPSAVGPPPGHDVASVSRFDFPPDNQPLPPLARQMSGPLPPRRSRFPWILMAAGTGVAVLIAGVVVALSSVIGQRETRSSTPGAQLAGRVFAPDPAATADGRDQWLSGVTAVDSTVVAVGGEADTIGDRAQFLVSTDGGRSFHLGTVRTPAGDEASYGDTPKLVAGAPGQWVALGSQQNDPTVWTSKDGRAWVRQPDTAGTAFNLADRVLRVAHTASGFVAVGDTSVRGDYSDARPVIWLSPDGRRWERMADQQLPMSVTSGNLSLVDVAASGRTVILHAQGAVAGGRQGSIDAVWRSGDAGRTWEKSSTPNPTNSYGIVVAATLDGFLFARNVVSGNQHYAVVMQSSDARQWTQVGEIHVPAYGQLLRFGESERGLVAVVATTGKVLLARSVDGRSWQSAGEVSTQAGRALQDVTATAGVTILVGTEPSRIDGNALLAVRDVQGQEIPVDLTRIPGAAPPDRLISAMASAGGRTVAVGSTNGDAAIWSSGDGRQWGRTPSGLTTPGRRRLVGVASGPSGWLAVGYDGLPSKQPLVVTSQDGATWQPDGSFKPSTHGQLAPFAAAYGPSGYVIVGEDAFSAATWHSADLKSWERGTATRAQDLEGAAGRGRWMRGITAGQFGYVAVGGLNDPTIRNAPSGRPAVWTSPDGKAWALLQLPLPDGATEATLQEVAVKDGVVIAAGTATTSTGWVVFAYLSIDGGKSWQQVRLPGMSASSIVTALTSTPRGFVIAGSAGPVGRTDVVLWTSRDGGIWSVDRPQGTGLTGNADHWLTAMAPVGGRLVATGLTADYLGEQATLWQGPLP
jgi:hypothetical protein